MVGDLRQLDESEKSVIREFFLLEKNSTKLPDESPEVLSLLRQRILTVIGPKGILIGLGHLTTMKVESSYRELIEKDPVLIGLPVNFFNKDRKQEDVKPLLQKRPAWAEDVLKLSGQNSQPRITSGASERTDWDDML